MSCATAATEKGALARTGYLRAMGSKVSVAYIAANTARVPTRQR